MKGKYRGNRIIGFRIPQRVAEQLEKVVTATGLSMGDIIRDGLVRELERYRDLLETEKTEEQ